MSNRTSELRQLTRFPVVVRVPRDPELTRQGFIVTSPETQQLGLGEKGEEEDVQAFDLGWIGGSHPSGVKPGGVPGTIASRGRVG